MFLFKKGGFFNQKNTLLAIVVITLLTHPQMKGPVLAISIGRAMHDDG